MLFFPRIAVIQNDIGIFLATFISAHMFYRNVEHVLTLISADIAAVSVGLLLKIVMRFPNHFLLHYGGKSDDIGKICWMKQ